VATAGDIINAFRLEAPDPPQTLPRPSAITLSAAQAGPVQGISLQTPGFGWFVGDLALISNGTDDAVCEVTAVGALGAVTGIQLVSGGTFYETGINIPVTPETAHSAPFEPFQVNILGVLNAGEWGNAVQVFVQASALNPWGETTPTGEVSVTTIADESAILAEITVGPGATAIRLYFGLTTGGETQYVQFPVPGAGTYGLVISGPTPIGAYPGTPPVQNSAWLPDTDGSAISAAQAYAFLNDGLTELTEAAGGILDSTGMQGIAQNMYYVVPGKWYEITEIRWDNWPGFAAKRNEVFYRIVLSGVPTLFTEEGRTSKQIIGAWPAPGADGNTTTLIGGAGGEGSPLNPTDQTMIIASGLNFTVQQRVLIDNELILYGQVNQNPDGTTTLAGLIRGVGGTRAAAHAVNATVTELKITVVGYRYPTPYLVGDGAVTLDIPPAWEMPIRQYMRYRYLSLEQGDAEAAPVYEQFQKHGERLRIQRMGAVRSLQVGPPLLSEDPAGAWEGRILIP